jgi:uncharacterized membrane protein YagU involved in acid resistance
MRNYLTLCVVLAFVVCTVWAVALWQGLPSFLFAWILNFILMMGVLYITQTFKPKLNSSYYDSKKWENEGKIYRYFGIHACRKVLVAFLYGIIQSVWLISLNVLFNVYPMGVQRYNRPRLRKALTRIADCDL